MINRTLSTGGAGAGHAIVGVVGGGQLARMLAEAASALGLELHVLAGADDDAVAGLASVSVGDHRSLTALERLAERCDVVTFDHEHVPIELVQALEDRGCVLRPSSSALRFADKAWQRTALHAAGLPVPRFTIVRSATEVDRFARDVGRWPIVLKPARGGYDGRGVHHVWGPDEAGTLLGNPPSNVSWVAEEQVPIDAELAVVVACALDGQAVAYPVVQTVQRDGICVELFAPAQQPPAVLDHASQLAFDVARVVGAVGILAVELFVAGDQLLVNEVAPRPHNTGHVTIEATTTSQFENHLRAVLGWPLGATDLRQPAAAMVNVLGGPEGTDPRRLLPAALATGDVHVHLYGKAARPGRKLGHVTALADDPAEALARARRAGVELGTPGPWADAPSVEHLAAAEPVGAQGADEEVRSP